MGDAGGDDDWYGYCLDDPVNGTDPLGLFQILGKGPGGRIVGSMIEGAAGGAVAGGLVGGPAGAAAGAAVGGAFGGLKGGYEEGELPEDRGKKDPNEPKW